MFTSISFLLTLIILWYVVASALAGIYLYKKDIGAGPTSIYCILVIIQLIWWIFLVVSINTKSELSSRSDGGMGGEGIGLILFAFGELIYSFMLLAIVLFCEVKYGKNKSINDKGDVAKD